MTKAEAVALWGSTNDPKEMRALLWEVPIVKCDDRYAIQDWDADWIREHIHPKWECYELMQLLRWWGACLSAREWLLDAGITTLDGAWSACDNTDWMRWMLINMSNFCGTPQYSAAITVLNNGSYIDQEACDMARSLCTPIWRVTL